jgi:hypothetical protein
MQSNFELRERDRRIREEKQFVGRMKRHDLAVCNTAVADKPLETIGLVRPTTAPANDLLLSTVKSHLAVARKANRVSSRAHRKQPHLRDLLPSAPGSPQQNQDLNWDQTQGYYYANTGSFSEGSGAGRAQTATQYPYQGYQYQPHNRNQLQVQVNFPSSPASRRIFSASVSSSEFLAAHSSEFTEMTTREAQRLRYFQENKETLRIRPRTQADASKALGSYLMRTGTARSPKLNFSGESVPTPSKP